MAYAGVFDGLDQLRTMQLQLAVVTNKPIAFTEPLLALTGLRAYFDVVVGGDSLADKKPHPAQI